MLLTEITEAFDTHKHPLANAGRPRHVRNRNGRYAGQATPEKEFIRMADLIDPIARYVRVHGYAEIPAIAAMVERSFQLDTDDETAVGGSGGVSGRTTSDGKTVRWVQAINNLLSSTEHRNIERRYEDIVKVVGARALATRQYCEEHGIEFQPIADAERDLDQNRAARRAARAAARE